MKKALLCVIVAAALALCSCSGLINLTYKDGWYTDSVNGIKYLNASVSYEPVSVGKEYARFNKTVLYEIPGSDPKKWMTEAFEGIGSVFYAEGVKLPSLSEFGAKEIHVCVSEINTVGIALIDDKAVIAAVIDSIENGENTEPGDISESYYLKIASDAYPFLYYNLIYAKAADGSRFLYDRGTKHTVEVGALLDKYLPENKPDGAADAPAVSTAA